jgi:hypothetical protein
MSALGIFLLKYPSLLRFDREVRNAPDSPEAHNFRSLFGVEKAPDDTTMRQTLDDVSTDHIRASFPAIFNVLKSSGVMNKFKFYQGSFLVAIDGTGCFSSKSVHCANCCTKKHKDGSVTYHHQMLSAAIVHPTQHQVVPLTPEPIQMQDGSSKNDCERNAAKRLLEILAKEYPGIRLTITEDALSANQPHIQEIKRHGMHFILGIKPGDHKRFFGRIRDEILAGATNRFKVERNGVTKEYIFINGIKLKEEESSITVNFLACRETSKSGTVKEFSWVTDFDITEDNAEIIESGGRARWRFETEVFNTVKNQGYEFEHNFGHGNKNLSTNLAFLLMLAFLIDQASELCCEAYQRARKKTVVKYSLWERMRSIFQTFRVDSWVDVFDLISGRMKVSYTFDTT